MGMGMHPCDHAGSISRFPLADARSESTPYSWRACRMATRDPDQAAELDQETLGGTPSDQSLLRRLQHGHEDASTEIYLRDAERLMALVKAQSSGDLARARRARGYRPVGLSYVFPACWPRAVHRAGRRGDLEVVPGDRT